jgi:hypothetical protein
MKNYEGRQADLKNRINKHLGKLTGNYIDFFSSMEQSDLMELKTVLADINNVLTLKMTIAAAGWICEYFNFDNAVKNKILEDVDSAKPNSKGFDIHIDDHYKILGEVKCVSPINNGAVFGVAQHDSILNDVYKLIYGKDTFTDRKKFLKFLFLIDLGERTDKAIVQLIKETKGTSILANKFNALKKGKIELLNDNLSFEGLDFEKVYIKKLQVK